MSNLINTNAGVAIAFWICVTAVIVAAIVASILKRRDGLAAIRFAIERGQQLDEKAVRALLGRGVPKDQRKELLIHGYVWTAFGIGFVVFGFFGFIGSSGLGRLQSILIGLGVLFLCLGPGLLFAARMIGRKTDSSAAAE